MDYTNDYTGFFLQTLSDWTSCIFVISLVGFGFLVYYLSIKVNQPTIEIQKNVKKRNKKDKAIKTKIVNKVVTPSLENQNIIAKPQIEETYIRKNEPTENDDNEMWIPVQKPKKNPKLAKQSAKNQIKKLQSNMAESTVKSPNVIVHKPETQCAEVKTICDSNLTKEDVALPCSEECKEIESENEIEKEDDNASEQDDPIEPEVELDEDMDNFVPRQSESPANSSSDDFVLVDGYKMSSDEGLPLELDQETVESLDNSVTSGASRKKNKKYQKIISKQLIEAAIIEGDEKSVEELVPVVPAKSVKKSSIVKKRRPRKDN